MISGQTEEEKSSDNVKEMEINHDVGASDFEHQNVLVSEDIETKGTKKVSKKRKLLDSEEADGKIANKKSKVDSKVNEEKAKTGKTVESSRSIMDINTPVPKIRNAGENRKNTKNAVEQLQHSTKSNENGNTHNSKNVGKQLENESIGKKGERPFEPKSITPFQRVKVDDVKFVDDRLKDNSYWAKDGADNGYGAKAQEVLGQVKGRNFRHEKNKKKRGSYRGQIYLQSHSVKFHLLMSDWLATKPLIVPYYSLTW